MKDLKEVVKKYCEMQRIVNSDPYLVVIHPFPENEILSIMQGKKDRLNRRLDYVDNYLNSKRSLQEIIVELENDKNNEARFFLEDMARALRGWDRELSQFAYKAAIKKWKSVLGGKGFAERLEEEANYAS